MPQSRRITPPHPHLFTCTFCWHLSRGPPHVLGRSARLTCEACYDAIIDLAICWVCGEIVCRGDDRRITQGTRVAELFPHDEEGRQQPSEVEEGEEGWDIWDVEHFRAKEILDIPLCANCVVEVEMDSLDRKTVVQKALRRTDKIDGGLNRKRWERKEGTIGRSVTGQIKRVPSKMARVSEEPSSTRTRPRSHRINVADGAASGGSVDSDQGDCVVPLDSTIYISILDPMGEPAFKPSPTKPIPKWMQRSSPQHRVQRLAEPRPVSIVDDHFQDVTSASAKSPRSSWTTQNCLSHNSISASTPTSNTTSAFASSRPSSRVVAQTVSEAVPSTYYSHKGTAHDQYPDLFLPSQLSQARGGASRDTHGPITTVSYHVPPPSRRTQTPSSEPGTGNDGREGSPRSSSRSRTPIGNILHRSSSPLAEAVISGLQRIMSRSRTPPPQSKEYLNLYRPTTATGSRSPGAKADIRDSSPSIGVAGRKRARRVEREEFDHMIRGQVLDAQDDGGREDEVSGSGGRQLKTKRKE
ncbi:hypothetical protein PG994_011688 [Apiospora phragmitis]|uniref:Uncharacterized protein n=1 Tax=Apiospora phragmitis TaxID=2905665 RepID=A0ABR1TTR3_9PEZI